MKRLAGELGCVCSGAVVTGLWYFSKDFWARVLSRISRGDRAGACTTGSAPAFVLPQPGACHIATCLQVYKHVFGDRHGSRYQHLFYGNVINVTLTVQA